MTATIFSLILLFTLLCTGSVLCCALGQGEFEDILPLSCAGIVLVAYFSSLFASPEVGFINVPVVAGVLLFNALLRGKKNPGFCRRFFTKGFFLFALLFAALAVCDYGLRLAGWDEFSHWGDVVKVMLTVNKLGTHPLANSMFPDYPPAMALFQYIFQRIYLWQNGGSMAEWLLFFAYQLFMLSLWFPFIKRLDLRKPGGWVMLGAMLLIPFIFQRNAYSKIYIDSFLATLFGVGFGHIVLDREPKTVDKLNILSILFLLPLTKDIGIAFALVLLVLLIIKERQGGAERSRLWEFGYVAAVLMPWGLWRLHCVLSSTVRAAGVGSEMAAGNKGGAYALEILKKFLSAMLRRPIVNEEALCPSLPPVIVLAGMLLLLFILLRREQEANGNALGRAVFLALLTLNIHYCAGTCIGYMFFYPEKEAEVLLGLERYLNMLLMGDAAAALLTALDLAESGAFEPKRVTAAIAAACLLFTPLPTVGRFVLRHDVAYSDSVHARCEQYYIPLSELTEGKPCRIFFADDEEDAFEAMLLRTELRPNTMELGAMPDDLSEYDYVVIFNMSSPPEGMENGGIYAVRDGKILSEK